MKRRRLRKLSANAIPRCTLHRNSHRPLSPPHQGSSHMTAQPAQQIPGVYHRRIGDIVVTAISDGYLDGNLDVMRNVDLEKAHKILREAFRPARRTSVNTFLIHSKGRMATVATGSGNYLQPTA